MSIPSFIMIDCETLSLEPNAAVWQIGAVSASGKQFKCTISPQAYYTPIYDESYSIERSTIQWQLRSNKENYEDALTISPSFGPGYLMDSFLGWYYSLEDTPTEFWSRRPIDFFWLNHALKVSDLVAPWKYWQCFDMMSAAQLIGYRPEKPPIGKAHDALEDATAQAAELHKMYELIKSKGF